MSTATLRWIGDLDQDKREQAGCVSSSSDQYRPKKIELRSDQNEIRIGRINTKNPPDYPIESCINSRMISRNHATIERSAKGGSILYDHSMNGTYVNYTRVMGGVKLKHGDIVCFGHLNGANLKPGEPVSLFYSDLKYRVELSDHSPSKEPTTGSTKKRKSRPAQAGSTVSSTQRSDGDDDRSMSSEDDSVNLKSRSNATARSRQKFKKPNRMKADESDVDEDDDDNEDDDDDDVDDDGDDNMSTNKRSSLSSTKGPKKRLDKVKKTNLISRKSTLPKSSSFHHKTDKRNRLNKPKSSTNNEVGNGMFHYDTEECSARPCKQPQDIAIDWIQCDRCTLWYHQVCVGLKPSDANVETYYCPYCKK